MSHADPAKDHPQTGRHGHHRALRRLAPGNGYDGLVNVGYEKHLLVEHRANEFASDRSHINGIESFWDYAKLRLSKFKGMTKHTINLHLKESEFRLNHQLDNLYLSVLKLLREKTLSVS